MGFESLISAAQRLSTSVEALAALGAQLRLQQDGLEGNPRVRALLNDIARAVDPQLLEDVDEHQQATTLALIQTIFRQALDLLENPARDLGWSYKDPVILQSQGQVSRLLVRGIDIMATQRHELGDMLKGPGAFLDVGTGVGWLAIEAARSWPALRVVGIDPWEPALTLARQNLAQSGVAERVELRLQRVEQFEETTTFTVAWLPGPFIAARLRIAPWSASTALSSPADGWYSDSIPCLMVHSRRRSPTCGSCAAAAIRGRPGRLRRSSRNTVSSKSKCTRPHRQFRPSLLPPSAGSCLWSGDGHCHLKISAAAPRTNLRP